MGNELSSASLLLTIVTILYSIWYQEINNGKNISPELHQEDNKSKFEKVQIIFWQRAFILVLITSILSLILLPDVIMIISNSLKIYGSSNYSFLGNYNSAITTFCLIEVVLFIFCGIFIKDLYVLHEKKKTLDPNK